MHTKTRRFEFDAAHRVLNHESKCRFLHGHRYVADVTVTAPGLDGLSMVVDFGVIQKILGEWIDHHWDHNTLLNNFDPLALLWVENTQTIHTHGHQQIVNDRSSLFADKQPFFFINRNPTAEVISEELFYVAERLLPQPLTVVNVRVYETPKSFADFSR